MREETHTKKKLKKNEQMQVTQNYKLSFCLFHIFFFLLLFQETLITMTTL